MCEGLLGSFYVVYFQGDCYYHHHYCRRHHIRGHYGGCEMFIKTSVSFSNSLYTNIKEKTMQILRTKLSYSVVLTI
jgi:hypothetical protein